MVVKKKERMSNFELLRILAMVLIIIHHIFVHAISNQLNDGLLFGPGEMFNNLIYYKRLTLVEFAYTFGKIGDNLFLLITGYFSLSKKDLHIKDKVIKLLTQLVYAVIVLVVISTLVNVFVDKSFFDVVGINILNTDFWFIGFYLLIVIIGDLFINKTVNKLSKEKFTTLVLVMTAMISLVFSVGILRNLSSSLEVLLAGIYFYILGGYISKYNPFKKIRGVVIICLIIATLLFVAVSYRNSVISSINYLHSINSVGMLHQTYFNGYAEYSFACVVIAVSIFELFNRIKLKNNKVINYISASTFMMYLLHDNPFGRSLLKQINWIPMYHDEFIKFIAYILVVILAIVVIGVVGYSIYNLLNKLMKTDKIKTIIYKN